MFGAAGNSMLQDVNRRMAGPSGMFGARGNSMLQDVNRRMAAKSVSNVPKNGSGIDLSKFAGKLTEESFPKGKKPLMSMFGNMTRGKKVGIGLGLGVAAGVAMNRRGQGVSPGRQSNARY